MFSATLKEARLAANRTQAELEAVLGMGSGYISKLESGRFLPGTPELCGQIEHDLELPVGTLWRMVETERNLPRRPRDVQSLVDYIDTLEDLLSQMREELATMLQEPL